MVQKLIEETCKNGTLSHLKILLFHFISRALRLQGKFLAKKQSLYPHHQLMPKQEDQQQQEANNPIDLSSLSNIEFETAWTPSSAPSARFSDRGFSKGSRRPSSKKGEGFRRGGGEGAKSGAEKGRFNPDAPRRGFGGKDSKGEKKFERGSGERKNFRGKESKDGRKFGRGDFKKAPFKFSMEVLFYPDDAPFAKMAEFMKGLKRTYQLFEIAQLILEKPERLIVLLKNLPDSNGETKPLYCAQPLNIPFADEASAKAFAVAHYVGEMFEEDKIEAEPPKGNFQVVNRCGISGDLLGAPNWHKYNEYVRDFHRRRFPKMSFEAFASRIETVRDDALISEWLENMKTRSVYRLKSSEEGENDIFENLDAASNYVARKMGDALVKSYEQARLRGVNISLIPQGQIRRNIDEALKAQRKFPIVTANNLRGRLRRTGFSVYKRGSKGFAFVSAVKRRFLIEGENLSEMPQKIFDFVSANAGIKKAEVPYKLLGLEVPEESPKVETLSEAQKNSALKSENLETAEKGELEDKVSAEVSPEPSEINPEAEAEAPAKIAEVEESDVVNSENEKLSESSVEKQASSSDDKELNSIWSELSWLISEGYVVEYADTSLQANPRMPKPKEKAKKSDKNSEEDDAENIDLGAADEPITQAPAAPRQDAENETESASAEGGESLAKQELSGESTAEVAAENFEGEEPEAEFEELAGAKKEPLKDSQEVSPQISDENSDGENGAE